MKSLHQCPANVLALIFAMVFLFSCSSSIETTETADNFSIQVNTDITLQEGLIAGANIAVSVTRVEDHNAPITISIDGVENSDNEFITTRLFPGELSPAESFSSINMFLAIADLPIMPHERTFEVNATDGVETASAIVKMNVEPVNAPDIYLLAGQSNMIGFSGDATKQAFEGGPDEPNPRIRQLNVTKNLDFDTENETAIFTQEDDFTAYDSNVISDNPVVQAEDPLHIPLDPNNTSGKDLSYIGLGLSFAKAALPNTTQNIVLVPAAWSGSAFCDNDNGPIGQWNAQATPDDAALGNTWLFDRAVERTNIALAQTGGILRGILWHQGESDANDSCSGTYLANLERLAKELRLRINTDARGGDLRRDDANIPFILGTMSRGFDENGDLSMFYPDKQNIDDAHKLLPGRVDHSQIVIADDLTPDKGFPCGNSGCIHFGPAALRELGRRYYAALVDAASQP